MCGRYAIRMMPDEIRARLYLAAGAVDEASVAARINLPPGVFATVAMPRPDDRATLDLAPAYWGFTPSWAHDAARAQSNARLETADRKPYWRKAFHRRRCVIPANWWYEWQRGAGARQAYAIRPADRHGFFFAGLWSLAKNLPADHAAANRATFAIVTTEAHADIAAIHQRMPVALTDAGARAWLGAGDDAVELRQRLRDGMHERYVSAPASNRIGSVANHDPALVPARISQAGHCG